MKKSEFTKAERKQIREEISTMSDAKFKTIVADHKLLTALIRAQAKVRKSGKRPIT